MKRKSINNNEIEITKSNNSTSKYNLLEIIPNEVMEIIFSFAANSISILNNYLLISKTYLNLLENDDEIWERAIKNNQIPNDNYSLYISTTLDDFKMVKNSKTKKSIRKQLIEFSKEKKRKEKIQKIKKTIFSDNNKPITYGLGLLSISSFLIGLFAICYDILGYWKFTNLNRFLSIFSSNNYNPKFLFSFIPLHIGLFSLTCIPFFHHLRSIFIGSSNDKFLYFLSISFFLLQSTSIFINIKLTFISSLSWLFTALPLAIGFFIILSFMYYEIVWIKRTYYGVNYNYHGFSNPNGSIQKILNSYFPVKIGDFFLSLMGLPFVLTTIGTSYYCDIYSTSMVENFKQNYFNFNPLIIPLSPLILFEIIIIIVLIMYILYEISYKNWKNTIYAFICIVWMVTLLISEIFAILGMYYHVLFGIGLSVTLIFINIVGITIWH